MSTIRSRAPCPPRIRSVSADRVSSMSVSGSRPVDLVEIDVVGLQAAQRVLDRADDPAPRIALLVRVLAHRAVDFGGQHDVVATALERLADDLLGLAALYRRRCRRN